MPIIVKEVAIAYASPKTHFIGQIISFSDQHFQLGKIPENIESILKHFMSKQKHYYFFFLGC